MPLYFPVWPGFWTVNQQSAHLFLGSSSSNSFSLSPPSCLPGSIPLVYLFIEKIEVWAVNCISGPLAVRASPHSGIHPERLPWEGGGVLLCCPQHLFPFHSSLVSLFQQSIILQQLAVNSGLERVPTEVSRSPVVKSNRYFIFPCAQPTS